MQDRELSERRTTVWTSLATASAAHWGYTAFLQGKVPGATSPTGPFVQARAVFGGVAPAPPAVQAARAQAPEATC